MKIPTMKRNDGRIVVLILVEEDGMSAITIGCAGKFHTGIIAVGRIWLLGFLVLSHGGNTHLVRYALTLGHKFQVNTLSRSYIYKAMAHGITISLGFNNTSSTIIHCQ